MPGLNAVYYPNTTLSGLPTNYALGDGLRLNDYGTTTPVQGSSTRASSTPVTHNLGPGAYSGPRTAPRPALGSGKPQIIAAARLGDIKPMPPVDRVAVGLWVITTLVGFISLPVSILKGLEQLFNQQLLESYESRRGLVGTERRQAGPRLLVWCGEGDDGTDGCSVAVLGVGLWRDDM